MTIVTDSLNCTTLENMSTIQKPQPQRSLILGGVKSGKSGHAEKLASDYSQSNRCNVNLVVTATASDYAMQKRIEQHKADRNPDWHVIEEPIALAATIRSLSKPVASTHMPHCMVVDCLTLWMTNLLLRADEDLIIEQINQFKTAVDACPTRLIMVSNETNMGVTPLGELSRRYCDEIGLLHQFLGKTCDHVTLMVAGLPHLIKQSTS